jgi:ATP-dependent DNA helicase PIF1
MTAIKELSPEQNEAMREYAAGSNIFLTGPGGSGKTELIKRMVAHSQSQGKKVQVCALTGCAAVLLNCKAKTLHSWAGIGIAAGDNADIIKKVLGNKYKKNNWTGIDILIIDEVSMMSLKLFDLLDSLGREVKKKAQMPFGGLQIVCSGDFYQLPPVGNTPETSAFCFESVNWAATFPVVIQLKTIFRQTDLSYTKILNQLRIGKLYKSSLDTLMQQVNKVMPTTFRPTILLPRRKDADLINASEMAKLTGVTKTYKVTRAQESDLAVIQPGQKWKKTAQASAGAPQSSAPQASAPQASAPQAREKTTELQNDMEYTFLINNIMADAELVLKVGAQVMCIANIDSGIVQPEEAQSPPNESSEINKTIVNGSQGIVVDFLRDLPVVQFTNGAKRVIGHHLWASETNPAVGVKQIPLIHAWAITIHKSQGVTLEMAQIDAGSNIFECGQTYVALSRVKSLEGLYLTALNPQKIRVNAKVQQFYTSL